MSEYEADLLSLYRQALDACMPDQLIHSSFRVEDGALMSEQWQVPVKGRVHLLAYGKASLLMYQAAREIVQSAGLFGSGLVITHQHDQVLQLDEQREQIVYSTHPFISELSFKAGQAAKNFVSGHDSDDVLIALISGGGSAMVALPVEGLELHEKIEFISAVMHMGVPEREVNVLKKALSDIKGGKLADSAADSTIINLILSDERNHQICAISSGMTVCNEEINPIKVMDQYDLWPHAPQKIERMLREHGDKRHVGCNASIINTLVGSREDLIDHIGRYGDEFGYQSVHVLDNLHSCTPEQAADYLVAQYQRIYREQGRGLHLVIGSGEVQVIVDTDNHGKGGRNQHLAALMMLNADFDFDFTFAAVATDGMDYLEGVHGAWFGKEHEPLIQDNRVLIESSVNGKNSYQLHQQLGTLLEGERTGTNLSDIFLFSFSKQ